ncbi:MAG: LysM peptidoglycan-binding domain-containing protein [Chthoniobacterales bacterium]|nr:LysM peptidoglycan-binding domain-containing protein [Chthoniobacterales bacterium]
MAPVSAPAGAPQATPAQASAAGRTHTVQKGETLAAIARKYYGSTGQWPKIAEANKDVFPDPTKLKPGMVLRIP